MDNLGDKLFAYSFYAISICSLLFSLLFGSALLAFLAMVMALLSIIYLHTGKLINNLLIKNSRVIVLSNGYELSNNLYSAVKKGNSFYESISIAILIVNSQISNNGLAFEQLLDKLKVPFEYSIELKELNKKRILEELETKLHMKEIQLANEKPNSKELGRLKREIGIIESEINAINSGGNPFNVEFKIKCRAASTSLIEATSVSQRNVELVANLFATSLNVGYRLLKGEELLNAI